MTRLLDYLGGCIGHAKDSVRGIVSQPVSETVKEIETIQPREHVIRVPDILVLVLKLVLSAGLSYVCAKLLVEMLDPTRKQKQEAKKRAEELMKRLGISNLKLTEYEMCFAADLIEPDSLDVSWKDIGGLEAVAASIKESVIFPFRRHDLFKGSYLIQPPKGLLLYGPPGCGKTMVAKAIAKDAGARFINFKISSLVDKWYGESQKRAEAVFSLAVKLQPSIIFIDEIDSFLRSRNSMDHEATAMVKAQFMSMWDGIITDQNCRVIIVAATNRPKDIDPAILRRMPCQFNIARPEKLQRIRILQLILQTESTEDINFERLGEMTTGMSGSDLKEVCRVAATNRIREIVQKHCHTDDYYDLQIDKLRSISMSDLEIAVEKISDAKTQMTSDTWSNFTLD